ncbi:MAG: hypothetical protein ACRD1F_12740, partial [Terriglobales bacterium]
PQADAVYYRAAPSAIESAPLLVPIAAASSTCWAVPASERPGASFTLELGAARAVKGLTITARGAPAYRLQGSHGGPTWTRLTPGVAVPAGNWQAFRITATAAAGPWQICAFSAR